MLWGSRDVTVIENWIHFNRFALVHIVWLGTGQNKREFTAFSELQQEDYRKLLIFVVGRGSPPCHPVVYFIMAIIRWHRITDSIVQLPTYSILEVGWQDGVRYTDILLEWFFVTAHISRQGVSFVESTVYFRFCPAIVVPHAVWVDLCRANFGAFVHRSNHVGEYYHIVLICHNKRIIFRNQDH